MAGKPELKNWYFLDYSSKYIIDNFPHPTDLTELHPPPSLLNYSGTAPQANKNVLCLNFPCLHIQKKHLS